MHSTGVKEARYKGRTLLFGIESILLATIYNVLVISIGHACVQKE